jgi:hypothetical protein
MKVKEVDTLMNEHGEMFITDGDSIDFSKNIN